jgi:hypothetical protein
VKRILIIAATLVLLAMLAVPMAAFASDTGDTTVQGAVTIASVTITAPSAINFGNFVLGENTATSATPGSLVVTPGTSGITAWTVTAQSLAPYASGQMWSDDASRFLDTRLIITLATWAQQGWADVGVTLTGATASDSVPFNAKQTIVMADTAKAGAYTITITFTASCTP